MLVKLGKTCEDEATTKADKIIKNIYLFMKY